MNQNAATGNIAPRRRPLAAVYAAPLRAAAFIPVLLMIEAVQRHNTGRERQILVGALVAGAAPILGQFATVATARAVGARVRHWIIGGGRTLTRFGSPAGTVELRPFPLLLRTVYSMPQDGFIRASRAVWAARIIATPVLIVAAAAFLPPVATLSALCIIVPDAAGSALRQGPFRRRTMLGFVLRGAPRAAAEPQAEARRAEIGGTVAIDDACCGDTTAAARYDRAGYGETETYAKIREQVAVYCAIAADEYGEARRRAAEALARATALGPVPPGHSLRLNQATLLVLAAEQDPAAASRAELLAAASTLAQSSGDHSAQCARAVLYTLTERPGEARAAADTLLKSRFRWPLWTAHALTTKAIVEYRAGRHRAARRLLKQAARVAPWNPRVARVGALLRGSGPAVGGSVDALAAAPAAPAEPWSVTPRSATPPTA